MNIKVLQVPFHFRGKILEVERVFHTPCNPVFNRDGLYKWGSWCWVEVGGEAFIEHPDSFDFELQRLDALEYPITDELWECLKLAQKEGFLSKKWSDVLWLRELQKVPTESKKFRLRLSKRIEEHQ